MFNLLFMYVVGGGVCWSQFRKYAVKDQDVRLLKFHGDLEPKRRA